MDEAARKPWWGRIAWWGWLIVVVVVLVAVGAMTRAIGVPLRHEITSQGLTASSGQRACDDTAKKQFPDGYNPAWVLGKTDESIQNDQWYFSYTAKVSQGGATSEVVIECRVSGTDTEPQVTSFAHS
ncbi:hypothetical protein ACPPVQ_00505 [Diaminobutyricibacter sp. McL0618]|uniref:hypothetical protein n=1 Tax=Leifsonia sp. McL0618 TaxID=3415677 RepID=UPI003CF3640E